MREHESSEQVEEECGKEWAQQKISKGLTLNVMKCVCVGGVINDPASSRAQHHYLSSKHSDETHTVDDDGV